MRRQIDYHLAHARAAASAMAGARALVLESAEGLVRTMRRLHADRSLTIDVQSSDTHVTRVQREDLDEMLGNLLDNACKWARRVSFWRQPLSNEPSCSLSTMTARGWRRRCGNVSCSAACERTRKPAVQGSAWPSCAISRSLYSGSWH